MFIATMEGEIDWRKLLNVEQNETGIKGCHNVPYSLKDSNIMVLVCTGLVNVRAEARGRRIKFSHSFAATDSSQCRVLQECKLNTLRGKGMIYSSILGQ